MVPIEKGVMVCKMDISRAFRDIMLDSYDCNKLGLKWQDYYTDICVAFGFRHGSTICQSFSDTLYIYYVSEKP